MATQDPLKPIDPSKPIESPFPTTPTPAPAAGTTDPFREQANATADTAQYQASTGAFDESKGAAGRVADITSQGGPLMQLAATRAKQQANRMGLMNSSMAVGAGQKAVIDAATPLAQTDAGLYQQQNLANQEALNQASARNAQARGQASSDAMSLGESARQYEASQGQRLIEQARDIQMRNQQQALDLQSRQVLQQMDADARLKAIELENTWKKEIQANDKLSGAWGTMMDEIGKIQNNPELNSAAKKTMVQQTLDQFSSYAKWAGASANVDVGDLLNFTTAAPGGATTDNGDFAKAPDGVTRADLLKYQKGDTFDRTDWQRWADATGYQGDYFGIDSVKP